jgi:hypothetical protein
VHLTATASDIKPWSALCSPRSTTRSFNPPSASAAPGGTLFAERRNRGYTLHSVQSGALFARLRSTDCNDRFEVIYWSLWKSRWISTSPFGRNALSIDDALRFIAYEDI